MAVMGVGDAVFLHVERPSQPVHVGGLQVFSPPPDAGPDHVRALHRALLEVPDDAVHPLFRRTAHRCATSPSGWRWDRDAPLDLSRHVGLATLAPPGDRAALLDLVADLHGRPLDRARPLWEAHLVEGLADGRFAVYWKVHHAVLDGIAALAMMEDALATDPGAPARIAPWALPAGPARPRRSARRPPTPGRLLALAARTGWELAGTARVVAESVRDGLVDPLHALPFHAPRSVLNVPISGARRVAAASWDLDRVRRVAEGGGVTVNDVVLAVSSGALRGYLRARGALPGPPLTAMVPMARRGTDQAGSGGNAVSTVLANLATDVDDPVERLVRISASARAGKARFAGTTTNQSLALSALSTAGVLAGPLTGWGARPPFNVVVSNLAGPAGPRWWDGARLDEMYPVSVPVDGQALNISVLSYAGRLGVGLTACARSVPDLPRLVDHLDEALRELEGVLA